MGGCYSVITASKRRRRGAAIVLPVGSRDEPVRSPDEDESSTGKRYFVFPFCQGMGNGMKKRRRWRRNATIPGEAAGADDQTKFAKRYRLGEELGRGEFGVTRRCVDTATGEALACKTIRRKRLRRGVDAEDVRREVEIMQHMSALVDGTGSGNVVRLREACEDSEGVHLVMELCKGGELFDCIFARGHYTERAAAKIGQTIAQVVQLCHENGVMHRDLKPENFLFANKSEDSPLKAIDFGLCVLVEFLATGVSTTSALAILVLLLVRDAVCLVQHLRAVGGSSERWGHARDKEWRAQGAAGGRRARAQGTTRGSG